MPRKPERALAHSNSFELDQLTTKFLDGRLNGLGVIQNEELAQQTTFLVQQGVVSDESLNLAR